MTFTNTNDASLSIDVELTAIGEKNLSYFKGLLPEKLLQRLAKDYKQRGCGL